ncbi:hypothetical protein ABPG73_008926, partial [Tetrahymena malaccensis]
TFKNYQLVSDKKIELKEYDRTKKQKYQLYVLFNEGQDEPAQIIICPNKQCQNITQLNFCFKSFKFEGTEVQIIESALQRFQNIIQLNLDI